MQNCLLYEVKYFIPPVSVYSYAILVDVPLNCFTKRNYRAVGSLVVISFENDKRYNTRFIRSPYGSSLCASCQSKHPRALFTWFISS